MDDNLNIEMHLESGYFSMHLEKIEIGQMTFYFPEPNVMLIDHAEVDFEYNGKGYARQMVAYAINYARENNLKIIPICPYVKSEFAKNEAYSDVLKR
jgi:uncharacterized protein